MPRITLRDLETDRLVSCPYTDALIGRDPSCPLRVDGPSARVVSGQHARVFFQDASWWIQDLSRNGTVLDQERLIKSERHAIHVDQVIGLGDSGPRLRVEVLESRLVAETLMEVDHASSNAPATTAARASGAAPLREAVAEPATAALRKSEAKRAGLRVEEPTEPMKPATDWVVHVIVRMTHTNQRHDVLAEVIQAGRSPDCAIQIPPELGASVSRVHAEITILDGGVVVRDADSRNGTFVNGERITEPHPARKGDLVMLGSGGPTFTIEDIRIVKGDQSTLQQSPDRAAPSKGPRLREPDTEPPEGEGVIGRVLRGIGRAFGK